MSTKLQFYSAFAERTARQITGSYRSWTAFLATAARLYKYPYNEQLMIYAQRPNATACAEYDFWKDRMGRYVQRGSTGIALIDTSGYQPRLRYVFDVADTAPRDAARNFTLWEMRIVRAGSPETAELTWSQVQRRLAQLIREDQFFTAQEKDVPENNPNYQLLDRLRADCEYFLGAGNRVEKHLWAGSVYAQIVKMRELYDALPQKPEWLTEEAIDDYADRMAPPYQVVTYRRLENGFDEKRDYQALEEAEKAAQGYVDGTMESNGFAYDGAAVYDLREDRYLSIVGDYPDEKAQAQAAGREQTEKPETSMNRAKNLISDFCQREYGSDADFSDPAKISVAYTTITDDEIPIQVNIDLVNFRLERYLDNEHLETRQYGSLQDLIANELDDLDFSDLIHISDEDAVQHRLHKPTKETEKAPKTVESASVHQEVSEQEVHETTSAQRFTATSYDDVFSIFDNLQHDVYVNDDRDVETFPSVEEAQAFADELNTKTKQAIHDLVGQRVEIDGVLYNVDAIDGHLSDDLAYLSAVPTADTDAEPKRTIDVVGYIRVLLDEQGRELAPNVSAYQALRAEHPEKLIGVRVGERLLFYGTDAERAASALHRRLLQRDISGMGETAVTGYDFGQWNSAAKRLLEHGHSFVFAQPDETGNYEIFNEGDAKDYIPIGMELEIDGRKFVIDSVNFAADEVSLQDVTFQSHIGYPIFRTEHIAFVRSFVEEQQKPLSYTIQPVEVIPAEQNHLPYDVVIQTLRTEPLEPVVSDPEPAETESPAMSEEEALILEHEGRAALSEMGEFVPDVNDAISQVEIDEPSAHRPVVSIPIDGEWTGFPSVAAAEQAAYADFKAASHRNAQNFHITDDALGVGGAKAKYQANINAIRLLKHLEAEGLQASAEQQQVLSRYVGWGGLADAFDESKDNWKDEFAELYATLSPEEYAAARASTLNAHYTSPTVINAIYEAVGNMGFQTGNILEPSMGVGNFFGCLPEQMQDSKLYGVELDSITGRIAKQLYPQANITVAGFETTDRRDFYDLAIGNVPFGQYQVNDRAYNKLGFSIHNYFFAKALDQVRPCGIVAFVTSRYTMDSKDDRARRYIAERADLLGAIRLPNNAFKANAGTDVVSDILFLQKRDRPLEIEPEWTKVGENADGFAINKYFIDHPEMILGRQSSESTQYGKQDFTVEPIKGLELADQLHDAVKYIRGTYQEAALPELGEGEQIDTSIPADPDVKNYSYKNLFLYTKMRNVAGLSTTDAQKSSDMLLKCRYIDEITGGKGVVFATGTPVSNSMTELFTMMRYLQHDTLRERDLTHFDCWASTFGETTTAIELAPEGTGYRARTRFAKFFNLPELMNLFKEAADIKTADQLHLPTPTPVYHTEVSQPTQVQQGMVQELSKRAAEVHSGKVNAAKDNMLKITSDGRKLGLDQRIINPNLPDDPCSKVNRCVDNIFRIWQEGQADKLTQLVFCDLSTPKASPAKAKGKTLDSPELRALETQLSKDGMEPDAPFSVYDDIRGKLVTMGIPREQIAFIHEANTEVRKKELFSKVRSGQVRVLMGSTFKMGAGMNVQDRLIALHDLDCPWRPGDLEQRSGRIIRQGNRNKEVHIYRYVTEGTFDAYLWQTIENKQRFISQIMTSKSPVRSCEDIDETALSYAEIKALCAGDERIKEKMDLDVDVARLKLMRSNHQSQQYRLEDNLLRKFPEQIDAAKNMIAGLETDIQTLAAHPHPEDGFAGMEVKGDNLTDKDNAGAALLETCKEVKDLEPVPVGSYRGFQMALTLENFGRDYILTLKGQMSYRVELGRDARGNLVRIDNALNAMPERVTSQKAYLDNLYAQVKEAKAALGKPFPQEEELRVKSARLAELNAELNIDDKTPMERLAGDSDAVAKSTRPSILQKLRAPLPEQSSPKPKHKEMEVQL